jgi:hypothetical protein
VPSSGFSGAVDKLILRRSDHLNLRLTRTCRLPATFLSPAAKQTLSHGDNGRAFTNSTAAGQREADQQLSQPVTACRSLADDEMDTAAKATTSAEEVASCILVTTPRKNETTTT